MLYFGYHLSRELTSIHSGLDELYFLPRFCFRVECRLENLINSNGLYVSSFRKQGTANNFKAFEINIVVFFSHQVMLLIDNYYFRKK